MAIESGESDQLEMEKRVGEFYDRLKSKEMDYFELFGLQKTATSREIEEAHDKYSELFPTDIGLKLSNPELKNKAKYIRDRINRAYSVLIDYDKRAQYEKMGFKDLAPGDLVEDDAIEKAKTLYRKAKVLHNQKNYQVAVGVMEEAIRMDPEKPDYYYLLGLCQSHITSLKRDAEQNLQKVVQMEPWNAEPYVALGLLFHSENLLKRAESYFRKALSLEKDHKVAKIKLEQIAGPDKRSVKDVIQDKAQKYLPTLFSRKKK